jgi:hypothetical protein
VFETLPQSVLGNEWLSNQQKETLLQDWQKRLSHDGRERIVVNNRSLFPEKYSTEEIVSALS